MRVKVLFLAVVAFTVACGGILERLQADVVAQNLLVDIGDPFDLAPRKATIVSNLASITGSIDDPSTSPISGATVTMSASSGATGSVNVDEDSPGVYRATSGSAGAATFVYTSGATYSVTMEIPSGDFAGTYTTQVIAPPRTEVTGLPDTLGGERHPVNTPLTVSLVGTYDRGMFVVVDDTGAVVYDSRPKTPQEAVDFAIGDFDGSLTIPAEVFAESNTSYGVVVVGLASAEASGISTNLHILSRFFAGSSKTAVIITD